MAKPRVFYALSKCQKLDPIRGDQINELYFLQRLAEHSDVYYNSIPFAIAACDMTVSGEDPAKEWAGDRKATGSVAARIPALTQPWSPRIGQLGKNYPLYYNNPEKLAALVTRFRTDREFHTHVFDYIDDLCSRLTLETAADLLADRLMPLLETGA